MRRVILLLATASGLATGSAAAQEAKIVDLRQVPANPPLSVLGGPWGGHAGHSQSDAN
jgi:hypothetical protein